MGILIKVTTKLKTNHDKSERKRNLKLNEVFCMSHQHRYYIVGMMPYIKKTNLVYKQDMSLSVCVCVGKRISTRHTFLAGLVWRDRVYPSLDRVICPGPPAP